MGVRTEPRDTMRKDAHESQRQIDLNYGFIHFSSERSMKPRWVKFIPLSDVHESKLKNLMPLRKYWSAVYVTMAMCDSKSAIKILPSPVAILGEVRP